MNRSSLAIIFLGWSSNEYADPHHGFHYLLAIDLCYLSGSCVSLAPHCMRLRACCCSGSKLSSDRTPLPNLDRTTSSSFLLMAIPFIVGPHQCSLTQGPEGRPQVEVVLRIRLPLAEFFDAPPLTCRTTPAVSAGRARACSDSCSSSQSRPSDNGT